MARVSKRALETSVRGRLPLRPRTGHGPDSLAAGRLPLPSRSRGKTLVLTSSMHRRELISHGTYLCQAAGVVIVTSGRTTRADVLCQMMLRRVRAADIPLAATGRHGSVRSVSPPATRHGQAVGRRSARHLRRGSPV